MHVLDRARDTKNDWGWKAKSRRGVKSVFGQGQADQAAQPEAKPDCALPTKFIYENKCFDPRKV